MEVYIAYGEGIYICIIWGGGGGEREREREREREERERERAGVCM